MQILRRDFVAREISGEEASKQLGSIGQIGASGHAAWVQTGRRNWRGFTRARIAFVMSGSSLREVPVVTIQTGTEIALRLPEEAAADSKGPAAIAGDRTSEVTVGAAGVATRVATRAAIAAADSKADAAAAFTTVETRAGKRARRETTAGGGSN